MATSRTGTSAWKNLRKRAIRRAHNNGVTHCRYCKIKLNFDMAQTPASAEVDHIVPAALGGLDTLDNAQVICRSCNGSKGSRQTPKAIYIKVKTSRRW